MIAEKKNISAARAMDSLSQELAEVREISDIIFRKIEQKIGMLNSLEASVDRKIASLEQLLRRAEQVNVAPQQAAARPVATTKEQQVILLQKRGLKAAEISRMLGMPAGEVELILGFYAQSA